jgi:hypothetical protein
MEDVRLETPKQLADRVGISEGQVRHLIATDQLEHVKIGSRVHIPVGAFGRLVEANKRGGAAWRDEIKVQGCDGLQREAPITSPGPSTAAAASARLARQTANKLKSSSQNGSNSEGGETAQVIRLQSS